MDEEYTFQVIENPTTFDQMLADYDAGQLYANDVLTEEKTTKGQLVNDYFNEARSYSGFFATCKRFGTGAHENFIGALAISGLRKQRHVVKVCGSVIEIPANMTKASVKEQLGTMRRRIMMVHDPSVQGYKDKRIDPRYSVPPCLYINRKRVYVKNIKHELAGRSFNIYIDLTEDEVPFPSAQYKALVHGVFSSPWDLDVRESYAFENKKSHPRFCPTLNCAKEDCDCVRPFVKSGDFTVRKANGHVVTCPGIIAASFVAYFQTGGKSHVPTPKAKAHQFIQAEVAMLSKLTASEKSRYLESIINDEEMDTSHKETCLKALLCSLSGNSQVCRVCKLVYSEPTQQHVNTHTHRNAVSRSTSYKKGKIGHERARVLLDDGFDYLAHIRSKLGVKKGVVRTTGKLCSGCGDTVAHICNTCSPTGQCYICAGLYYLNFALVEGQVTL